MSARTLYAGALLASSLCLSCGSDHSSTEPEPTPTPHSLMLQYERIKVWSNDWEAVQIIVPQWVQDPRLHGSFAVDGGNVIRVALMTRTDYDSWRGGGSVTPIYNSGKVAEASFDEQLEPGHEYWVVLDNTFTYVWALRYVLTRLDLTWLHAAARVPDLHSILLYARRMNVPPDDWSALPVNVPTWAQDPHITASYEASGGSGDDIRVFVMTHPNYDAWIGGAQAVLLHYRPVAHSGDFDLQLDAGTEYYIVLDNRFSTFSDKAVTTNAVLSWRE